MRQTIRGLAVALALILVAATATADPPAPTTTIANIELGKAFAAKSPWRLVAPQGPSSTDVVGNPAPGGVQLCLRKTDTGPCDQPLPTTPASRPPPLSTDWPAHYLNIARVVYPGGPAKAPLLLVQTASEHSGDGDQAIYTQL